MICFDKSIQISLLGNDVAENPGPETKVGEVSVFHWNSRSIRHKLDHLQTISITSNQINSPPLNSKSLRLNTCK
jgi:hypothetical protein